MRTHYWLFLIISFLSVPAIAFAAERMSSIILPAGEIVHDNYVRVGQDITIQGSVEGDVIAAAQTVTITGSVAGDVIAAAQTVTITGEVAGNVRVAAETIDLSGNVGKNATLFGATLRLGEQSTIGWSLQAFAEQLFLRGTINKNAHFYGNTANVQAAVGGNAVFRLGDEGVPTLLSPTTVGGNLHYESDRELTLPEGVTVAGSLERIQPAAKVDLERTARSFFIFLKIASLFGVLVLGLILVSVVPRATGRAADLMRTRPGATLGWGLIAVLLTPIVCFLLLFTVIGIPLAIILLLVYGILLYLSKVVVGLALITWLRTRLQPGATPRPSLWLMVAGVILYILLTWIPWIGWWIGLLGTLWGVGGLLLAKRELLHTEEGRAAS